MAPIRGLREWIVRLWGSLRPSRPDADLDDEVRFHLEMAAEDARRRGNAPQGADRAARLQAGGGVQAIEALRDQRGLPWIDDLRRDVRHGVRMLRRSPGFTVVAVLTLALGIGANAAIFAIADGVLLQPLGYPQPQQLMRLTARFPELGNVEFALSTPEYVDFRTMTQSFADVGAFAIGGTTGNGNGAWTGAVNLVTGDRPVRVRSALVDEHLLRTLAVPPAHGRLFGPGETEASGGAGGPPIAILSHELWQRAFGGEPVVGRTVDVDGRSHEVIGVMPPGVDVMDHGTEIWLPLGVHPQIARLRGNHILSVIGRLKDGVTVETAQSELDAFLERWSVEAGVPGDVHVPTRSPGGPSDHTLHLEPLHDAVVGGATQAIWVLQGAVALVLLIACVNLANLTLARSASRRGELVMRAALGAGRGRLVRQMTTEGLLLSMTGGALGLWLAHLGVRALGVAYPETLPRMDDVALGLPVLLLTITLAAIIGLVFGITPLAATKSGTVVGALERGSVRGGAGSRRHRLRRAFVTAEVALAVVLVMGAGVLLRTVFNLANVDAGFDRTHLTTFSLNIERDAWDARARLYQRILDALRAMPGVESATAMSDLPLDRAAEGIRTGVENYTNAEGRPLTVVDYYQFVMADYFETMGIPIVAGRGFTATDTVAGDRTVVISESLARRLWPGQDPIGRRIQPNLSATIGTSRNPLHTVIGVAGDVKEGGVDREAGTELYLFVEQPAPRIDGRDGPWALTVPRGMHVALRTTLPPATLAGPIERAVHAVDRSAPVAGFREMEAVFETSIRQPRMLAQLLGGFAGLALLLAAIGTFGVLSYAVTERRREFGIRMALGAARSDVLALVMKDGLRTTVAGIVLGVAGALAANRLLTSLLFGVSPTDAVTLAVVIGTITVVAALACWLPASRAAGLDPNAALKTE